MDPFFWILLLIVLNIPIFVFLLWLVFDNVRNAKGDFLWGVFKTILCVFSLGSLAELFVEDDDSSFVNSVIVLFVYAVVIGGEYWLITQYLPDWVT